MSRVKYLVALAGFYVGEALGVLAGVGCLALLAASAVFFLAAGAVVVAVGFILEEFRDLFRLLRG